MRISVYRFLVQCLAQVVRRVISRPRFVLSDGCLKRDSRRVWIHAASAGELEILWGIAVELARLQNDLVITVFSSSGLSSLKKLADSIVSEFPDRRVDWGLSPLEGEWGSAVQCAKPIALITAKYEAWPELWASLSEQGVRLVILNARFRSAFAWVSRILTLLGVAPPQILFLCSNEDEKNSLKKFFNNADLQICPDPRWDRVLGRAQAGNDRASLLVSEFQFLPRPWGVLGSVWQSDLEQWKGSFLGKSPGTLWVVPHKNDRETVQVQRAFLKECGFQVLVTSEHGRVGGQEHFGAATAVLVDEMGFLAELYAAAQWAYVGGGFGEGVHSTIEPAIRGIPIACGPCKIEKFPEISELMESGQLEIVDSSSSILSWHQRAVALSPDQRHHQMHQWMRDLQKYQGGLKRAVSQIVTWL